MTNIYNIACTDGNIMVPVLSETGSLMAYMLYTDPTGMLKELYSCMTMFRPYSDNIQTIPRPSDMHNTSIPYGILYHKNANGCTGQPIIQKLKFQENGEVNN